MKILVVGGAGYIGSHCVRQLLAQGYEPVILDNLIYGHRAAIPEGVPYYYGNLGDKERVREVLRAEEIQAVMHFAAFIFVGESVQDPAKYYRNNVLETLQLLEVMLEENVKRFVFSSTAAVYGMPERMPITEDLPLHPINPYGQTKLDIEHALASYAQAYGLSFAAFRYFNAAGASADATIGEDHNPETHLIPLVIAAALGQRENIKIFGTDYDTPDGTCLRDYIHVDDLSRAHIKVIDKLAEPGLALRYNLGVGKPYSVREIIQAVERVSGKTVPVVEAERRAGDPAALYADSTKAQQELGWQIEYAELDAIIETAWNWHSRHPKGFASK